MDVLEVAHALEGVVATSARSAEAFLVLGPAVPKFSIT
jgi:hypothetical protein